MRGRLALVLIVLATVAVPASLNKPEHIAAMVRLSHYSLQPMSVQYNAWGALGTSSSYNTRTTAVTNSVTSRLIARGSNVAAISLNEMCVAQSFTLTAQLAAAGIAYGGHFLPSRWDMTDSRCGTQFGNVAYVNGGSVVAPYTHYYATQAGGSETRNVVCVRNAFYYSCSTHLAAGATSVTATQLSTYRDIVIYTASVSGLGVFASGDFNYPLNLTWYAPWINGGFVEADSWNRITFPPESAKYDYTFRRNPGSWIHVAYVTLFTGLSDHSWLQGYL